MRKKLKVYIINLNNTLAANLLDILSDSGIETEIFNNITNLVGFSSASGCSMLIVGENHHIDNYSKAYSDIAKVSKNPVIFIANAKSFASYEKSVTNNVVNEFYVLEEAYFSVEEILNVYNSKKNIRVKKYPMTCNKVQLDVDNHICSFLGKEIDLTKTEMSILFYLITSKNMNVSHEDMMNVFHLQGKK